MPYSFLRVGGLPTTLGPDGVPMSRQDPWGARPQGTAWTGSARPREGHAILMTLDNGSCSGKYGPVGPEGR